MKDVIVVATDKATGMRVKSMEIPEGMVAYFKAIHHELTDFGVVEAV